MVYNCIKSKSKNILLVLGQEPYLTEMIAPRRHLPERIVKDEASLRYGIWAGHQQSTGDDMFKLDHACDIIQVLAPKEHQIKL